MSHIHITPWFAVLIPPPAAPIPFVALLLLHFILHTPRAAPALRDMGKAFNTHENVCGHSKFCSTAWFDSTLTSTWSYPALSHIPILCLPGPQGCVSHQPSISLRNGKTIQQLLKNQRFVVLHTIMSYPGLG